MKKFGIGHYELRQVHAVQPLLLQHVAQSKPVVKYSKSSPQDHLRRALPSADSPRKSQPRCPVRVIVDVVLRFKPQSVAEGDVRPHPPVVLNVQAHVHLGHIGRADWRASVVFPGVAVTVYCTARGVPARVCWYAETDGKKYVPLKPLAELLLSVAPRSRAPNFRKCFVNWTDV